MSFIRELMTAIVPTHRRFREAARRYPRQFAALLFATVIVYVGIFFLIFALDKRDREEQRAKSLSYDSQLNNLKQTETSLRTLLTYVEDQKTSLDSHHLREPNVEHQSYARLSRLRPPVC